MELEDTCFVTVFEAIGTFVVFIPFVAVCFNCSVLELVREDVIFVKSVEAGTVVVFDVAVVVVFVVGSTVVAIVFVVGTFCFVVVFIVVAAVVEVVEVVVVVDVVVGQTS